MKILIVGEADSVYIKALIENTLIRYHDDVSILSYENNVYRNFYKENNVKVYRNRSKGGKLSSFMSANINKRAFMEKYDIISIHYISGSALKLVPAIRRRGRRIMLTYWGSDLLIEANTLKRKLLGKAVFGFTDKISFVSENLLKKFHEVYGRRYDKKLYGIVDFGSEVIDRMADLCTDENEIRSRYEIDENAVTVAVGYNNSPKQHHLEVLKSIALLPQEAKSRIHLLFRLTYGTGSREYLEKVRRMIKSSGCRATLFESRLTADEIAELTSITDIFIHAQTTDACSASVCEHLYAGSLVLNGSWLRYEQLENKAFYLSFADFDELLDKLAENIGKKNDSRYCDRLQHNKDIIFDMFSWKKHIPDWRKLYRNLLMGRPEGSCRKKG